jgi:predicted RNA binding protein YcfA (HicA-like mRNA interferase family)
MKVKQVERVLRDNGWTLDRQKGSHRQYVHGDNENVVTVSGKPNADMTPGQLAHIRRVTELELR